MTAWRIHSEFCTNPDGQRVLANASPSEVEDEVKHVIAAFAGFGGGLIAPTAIQASAHVDYAYSAFFI